MTILRRRRARPARPLSPAERFRALLSDERVIDSTLERKVYSRDGSIEFGDAGLVVLPESTAEVVACVQLANELGMDVVPRGSGTGLAGGAVPLEGSLVIALSRMTRILEVDPAVPCAWVEPGVLNLDISSAVAHLGLHYAPDPSSQAACSIGGNVGTNAGGPHCLSYGVTAQHVLEVEVVLGDGEVLRLGGAAPDPPGYDLRAMVVGSEGTLGIVTATCVRLTRNPAHIRTMLIDFPTIRSASDAVSGIIAGGVVPAAIELMDQATTNAVEQFVHADLPIDAAAVLIVEVDGDEAAVLSQAGAVERIATDAGALAVRTAQDEAQRAIWWKARKSAFGAVARIAPNYFLHDCVVPRTHLAEILETIGQIGERHQLQILNVFHAGDGNLHPLIAFDLRDAEQLERVRRAGDEIVTACLQAGGSLSGEHGVGIEKRDFMRLAFDPPDLDAQARARDAFDPAGRMNPHKVLPEGSRCAEAVSPATARGEGS